MNLGSWGQCRFWSRVVCACPLYIVGPARDILLWRWCRSGCGSAGPRSYNCQCTRNGYAILYTASIMCNISLLRIHRLSICTVELSTDRTHTFAQSVEHSCRIYSDTALSLFQSPFLCCSTKSYALVHHLNTLMSTGGITALTLQ